VKKTFIGLHARTFSHATEDLEKVKLAFANAVGGLEMRLSRTAGHHGNPITIIEGETKEAGAISDFFGRLTEDDLQKILRTVDARTDEGCNLFIRLDKQAAYDGRAELTDGEDVVSVRIRVSAFPSRCEIAKEVVRAFITEELAKRCDRSGQ
jgi:RNA binding exosome subunit